MRTILFVSLIISLLHLNMQFSTSEQIMASIQNYIDTGKMINNKFYFIYDEKNYTKLNINGKEMKNLYSLQNQTYWKNNNLSNYILLVDNIAGDGKKIVKDLAINIIDKYNLGSSNYFVFLISITTQQCYGYPDNNRPLISDIKAIIENIGNYLFENKYFQALGKEINDNDYDYNKVYASNPTDKSKDEDSSLTWLWILLGAVGLIILIIIIVCIVKNCCGSRNSGYVKGMNNNYRNNKSNNDNDYYDDNTPSHNVHIISHHHSDHSDDHHHGHSHGHHSDNDGDHGHAVESSWGGGDHGHAVESSWGGGGHAVESSWGGGDSGGYDGGYDGGGDCGGDCGGDGGGD